MPYNLWVATINIQTPETSAHQFCQAKFFFPFGGSAHRNQDTLLDCILFYSVIVFVFIILPVIFFLFFISYFVCLALDLRFKKINWNVFYFLNFSILPFFLFVWTAVRHVIFPLVVCTLHHTEKRFIYFF